MVIAPNLQVNLRADPAKTYNVVGKCSIRVGQTFTDGVVFRRTFGTEAEKDELIVRPVTEFQAMFAPIAEADTEDQPPPVILQARKYIGIKESTGRNDGKDVLAITGGVPEPWCAHFVARCFREIGKPLPEDVEPKGKVRNPIASCDAMYAALVKQNRALPPTVVPQEGDIIFFCWSSSKKGTADLDHVGLVESVNAGQIHTIEGNADDQCMRKSYRIGSPVIRAFAR